MGVNQCVIAASNAVMDKLGVKIDDAITQYAELIFDMLRRYEYNPKLMRLYITGGGGKLIENFGRYEQFALMTYRKDGRA